jgi:NAD(P)-dependent dehydrogenase (short-subunit alcohol dehydrogenase family)
VFGSAPKYHWYRVTLITGARSGVKRAIAVAFAKAGARVVAADINVAGAEETAAVVFSWYCSRGFPTSLH